MAVADGRGSGTLGEAWEGSDGAPPSLQPPAVAGIGTPKGPHTLELARGWSDGEAFRAEFRYWLEKNVDPAWKLAPFPRTFPPGDDLDVATSWAREWQARLHEGGWLAPGWPVEHGGRDLDLECRLIMAEELARVSAPMVLGFQGVDILGPALIEFGSKEMQERFLPRILSGDDIWCQGYSEPGSGSDLASVRTSCVRDGGEYIVNGQKVWTSYGRRANWCFLLVRTGGIDERSRGLTFLLTPMDAPGIEWRPITQLTGEQEFGELFLTNVRVPCSLRVGDEGGGWAVATHSLGHERLLSSNLASMRRRMDALLELVQVSQLTPVLQDRVVQVECRLMTAAGLQSKALALAKAHDVQFAAWASLMKLSMSEIRVDIATIAMDILGIEASAAGPAGPLGRDPFGGDLAARWAYEFLESKAGTIYAGTSEIQRNIIAEVGLGLPR